MLLALVRRLLFVPKRLRKIKESQKVYFLRLFELTNYIIANGFTNVQHFCVFFILEGTF